jgi:D-glycero-alpha-D-manno-heptose 1-phosphate guanylyltransferase
MTSAVILAGGLGTRLRSVVSGLPKPMAPINGKPFLERLISYWIGQGINHFVLSVGYLHQTIIDYFGNYYDGVRIDYVIEDVPLGTGGGLILALEKISHQNKFLLLNGDTFFEINLKSLVDYSNKNNADWCFSLFRTTQANRYLGINILQDGQIDSLSTESGANEILVNGGVYLINPLALIDIGIRHGDKMSLESDIFPKAMKLGQKFFGKEYQNLFIDIGIPEDYVRALLLLDKLN